MNKNFDQPRVYVAEIFVGGMDIMMIQENETHEPGVFSIRYMLE